jgi:hypothetical protein
VTLWLRPSTTTAAARTPQVIDRRRSLNLHKVLHHVRAEIQGEALQVGALQVVELDHVRPAQHAHFRVLHRRRLDIDRVHVA